MKLFVRVIATLIIILAIALLWLGMTETGLLWSYQYAKSYLPVTLKLNSVEGHLFGVMKLKGVEYKLDDTVVKADEIVLNWSPSDLLVSKIGISKFQVESLTIALPKSKQTNTNPKNNLAADTLPNIYLPWGVSVSNANINGLTLYLDGEMFVVEKIKLSASSVFDKLTINELTVKTETEDLSLNGDIQLANDYQHQLGIYWQTQLSSGEIIKGNGNLVGNIQKTVLIQQLVRPVQATLNTEITNLLYKPQWQAKLNVPQFEVSKLIPDASGMLATLTLEGNGDLSTVSLQGSVTGRNVSFEHPFDASVKLQLKKRHKGFDVNTLELISDEAQLNLQGQVTEQLKLDWSLSLNDLAKLYPQAKGKLHSKGSITGTTETPIIKATYTAQALGLDVYTIGMSDGSFEVDLFHWENSKLKLHSKNIGIKDYPIQSVNISANNQQIMLSAVTKTETVKIQLKGNKVENEWRGQIKQADILSQEFGNWNLKSPFPLNISNTAIVIESLCWFNQTNSSLCASITNKDNYWKSKLILNKFPLSVMNALLSTDINFDGQTNAVADLQFHMPNKLLGQVKFEFASGKVSYPLPDGEHGKWDYQSGTLNITLTEHGLKSESEITINKQDKLHFKANLPGMKLLTLNPQKQSIDAKALLTVREAAFLEALIPETQDIKGEFAIEVLVTGNLAQPQIKGHADLMNGSLRIPRLGLTISKLKLNGKTDNFKKLNFQLNAHSGEGDIDIHGQTHLDSAVGWPTEMTIKGEQFEISRIPEARVVVSPDLTIKLQKNTIDVQGKVHIPYAKLQPKDTTTATRVSQDVSIIGNENIQQSKWSIVTKIRLTLGERVNFYGYGFEGRFGGTLLLEDKPGQLTRATGEINVPEGKYQAYGQNLTVEHGRLIYTGGPISNPGLDLRAVRVVNNITAGLKVKGSLNEPKIELFSIPAMGQTNILSYLIMGAPIEKASGEEGAMMAKAALALGLSGGDTLARKLGDEFGLDQMRVESSDKGDQASLVMGRYLSPKLYVSYGVGLIESFNTFTVRYQLSNKWHIKAESGEAQGADILYTIER